MGAFTLDVSVLGGGGLGTDETIIEDRGRSVTLTWTQADLDADMQLLGYSLRFAAAEPEAKEILGGN